MGLNDVILEMQVVPNSMNKSELAIFCQVVLAPYGRKMRDGGGHWSRQLLMSNCVGQRACLIGLKALTTCSGQANTEEQQAEHLIVREKSLEMFAFSVATGLLHEGQSLEEEIQGPQNLEKLFIGVFFKG